MTLSIRFLWRRTRASIADDASSAAKAVQGHSRVFPFASWGRIAIIWLIPILCFGGCATSDVAAPDTTRNNTVVVYQPPAKKGGKGRLLRIEKDERHAQHVCGEMSPMYRWFYEVNPLTPQDIDLRLFEYPHIDETNEASVWRRLLIERPHKHRNNVSAAWFIDETWTRHYHSDHLPGKRYSIDEAKCWANHGDQLAMQLVAVHYTWRAGEAKEALELEKFREFALLAIGFHSAAAAPPKITDFCTPESSDCATSLLAPFETGLPSSHYILFQWASGSVESFRILEYPWKDPSDYLQQALRAGHGFAFYRYYKIPMN